METTNGNFGNTYLNFAKYIDHNLFYNDNSI